MADPSTVSPATTTSCRRPWGSVRRSIRELLASDSDRVWAHTDVATGVGITAAHAFTTLCELTRAGELSRDGAGFRVVRLDTNRGGARHRWRVVTAPDKDRLVLRRGDGTLWVACPLSLD